MEEEIVREIMKECNVDIIVANVYLNICNYYGKDIKNILKK